MPKLSPMNEVQCRLSIIPEVGMGATKLWWSDRTPYTIIRIVSEKCIVIQEDLYRRIDHNGMSEDQTWEMGSNPTGITVSIRKHKDGAWYDANGGKYLIGKREVYYDYSF